MNRARNCQREPWRCSMNGNPANRKLAKNAPSERKMARTKDFWRKRKKLERRRTTLQCTLPVRCRRRRWGWFAAPNSRLSAPRTNGSGQLFQQTVCFSPIDTAVGNALAVDERLARNQLLRSGHQVALDHRAHDVAVPCCDLCGNIVANNALPPVILAAVGMAEIDHD